jgi:hypothetical protein
MFDVGGVWEKLGGSTTAKVVDRGASNDILPHDIISTFD